MKTRLWAFLTLAFFALFHPLLAWAQQTPQPAGPPQYPWGWPGHWHMWGDGWGFSWLCPLIMLFIIIVCVAIFRLGRRSGGGGPHHWGPSLHMMDRGPGRSWADPTSSALQILNERFAKGELQKAEYEDKKAAILAGGQH
jgi:putative membrane protein